LRLSKCIADCAYFRLLYMSVEIISFVFGFLFGVSIYVIRYGFSNLERLKLPKPKFTFLKRAVKAIRDLRERQKVRANPRWCDPFTRNRESGGWVAKGRIPASPEL